MQLPNRNPTIAVSGGYRMKFQALLVVALSGAAVLSAQAADRAVPRESSYYPNAYNPTSVDWTGWYVGAQVGGGFGSASWTDPFSLVSDSLQPAGFLGGGQFGVNWSRNSWLLGAEADFTGTDLQASAAGASFRSHWLSLVTARVGYAVNQYLIYAKGGAAFANERNEVITPAGRVAESATTTLTGWTVGAGVEYAINPNWSARLEYDFVDFPSHGVVLVEPPPAGVQAPSVARDTSVDFTIQKVVVGINYRF